MSVRTTRTVIDTPLVIAWSADVTTVWTDLENISGKNFEESFTAGFCVTIHAAADILTRDHAYAFMFTPTLSFSRLRFYFLGDHIYMPLLIGHKSQESQTGYVTLDQ